MERFDGLPSILDVSIRHALTEELVERNIYYMESPQAKHKLCVHDSVKILNPIQTYAPCSLMLLPQVGTSFTPMPGCFH